MNFVKKTWWLWLIVIVLCGYGVSQYWVFLKKKNDPCLTQTVDALVEQYPRLKELREKQQNETAKLLAMQRQQDVIVNLEMSSEQMSPEQALRMSIGQIDQLAELRKHQSEEFRNMCHEVVSEAR